MNGYIQLTLGGKKRGLKFGNRALLSVMQKHKVDEGIQFSFELICDLIYFALLNNCLIKKEDPDFTEEDVAEWTDDIPMQQLLEIFESFQGSFQAPGSEVQDGKMKITKTKTTAKK